MQPAELTIELKQYSWLESRCRKCNVDSGDVWPRH